MAINSGHVNNIGINEINDVKISHVVNFKSYNERWIWH